MSDINNVWKRQTTSLIVLWVNFALFVILFAGLGFLIWQSAALVVQLREELAAAEETVADLRNRLQTMDPDVVVDRLLAVATDELERSITTALQTPELAETMEAIRRLHETFGGLDPDEMARAVSSNILLGLSDGLRDAAEAQSPGVSQ